MAKISPYRLGDLVLLSIEDNVINEILLQYPNSIASKFILQGGHKNDMHTKMNIITDIVVEHMQQYKDKNIIPKDINNSVVIHLRLGDVVAGHRSDEIIKSI